MITPELIQQTEARFAERQAIRQEREAKIKAGAILDADAPDRVKERIQHLTRRAIEIEGVGVGVPTPGQPATPTTAVLERILGKNDLMSINYLEIGIRVARTVGRVHIRNPDGQLIGYGTGSLVSPRLLITNNHVLENAAIAGGSRIEFNFQEGPDGRLLSSFFVNFDSDAFFVTDKALDFSIVALKGDLRGIAKFGWNGLSAAEGKLIVGEYVTIIQHPSGERKQIALRENQVIDMLPNFAHYRTDTSPGSSGSPVFNDQWEMVALHHSGIPKKDPQGRLLARDGSVWNAGMGENAINWIANEGVRVSKILEHLKGLSLSGAQAALRKQLFDSEKGWVGSRSGAELVAAEAYEAEPGARGWTLPLQLSIGVGESASDLVAGGATPRIELSSGIAVQANGGGEKGAVSGQDELVSAWRSYESATRPSEAQASPAPAPVRQESALEWLTGQPTNRPATMQEQFAQNGSAR